MKIKRLILVKVLGTTLTINHQLSDIVLLCLEKKVISSSYLQGHTRHVYGQSNGMFDKVRQLFSP